MNQAANPPTRPKRNITWPQPLPAVPCEHQYEAVTDREGLVFRRCRKCGRQEAK